MKLVKFNYKREEDLRNNKIIVDLVEKAFSLSNESLKYFKQEMENPSIDEFLFEKFFKNTEDLRLRIPLNDEQKEKCDRGWTIFNSRFSKILEAFEIQYNYQSFVDNSFEYLKNKFKIQKLLVLLLKKDTKKFDLFSSRRRDGYSESMLIDWHESNIRACFCSIGEVSLPKKEELELVISANFADFFMASTAENWNSCISLESGYDGAMWAGLPGLVGDKNRVIFYLTSKKKKEYLGIKVDSILSRTWSLLDHQRQLSILNFYPNKLFDIDFLTEIAGVNVFNSNTMERTRNEIIKMHNTHGESIFIYQDHSKFKFFDDKLFIIGSGYSDYYSYHDGIDCEQNYDYSSGLKALLKSNKTITDCSVGSIIYCDYCDDSIPEGEEWHDYCDDIVCRYCFQNHNVTTVLGNVYSNNDSDVYSIEDNGCSNSFHSSEFTSFAFKNIYFLDKKENVIKKIEELDDTYEKVSEGIYMSGG